MILRKPYGFLIKHFRLIHLFLTGLYIYLLVKVNSILNYYVNYLKGTENRLNALKLTTNYYLIAIILSIVICIIIYALMRYKKKPKLLYFILIVIYILIAVVIGIVYGGLNEIYIYNKLELKTLRLYRDILRITELFQYITIAFVLIRGLGFDIKKFNFKEDIADLNLSQDDEEEVELSLGTNEGIFRKIRKKIREYTYYYKENKLILISGLSIIAVIILISTLLNTKVINKTFSEKESVDTDLFNLNVVNTYITNKSYSNKILSNDMAYVIVKMYLIPKSAGNKFNTGNLTLQINKTKYSLIEKNNNNFKDIGNIYSGQRITSSKLFIFIYNIPKSEINKKMLLTYSTKTKINLKPQNIDEESKTKELKLKDELSLSDSIIGSGTIKINSVELKDSFTYDYNYEANGKNYSSKISIKSPSNIILNLKITSNLPSKYTTFDLISNYGKIKYKVKEEEYISSIFNNKTPGNYNEGLFLEVDKNIENASDIWLEMNIRNKSYSYKLK